MRHHHRTSFALLILFVAGVCVLWWADYTDLPTREKQQELLNRLLPELADTPVSGISRVEIDRTRGSRKDRISASRVGGGWQIVAPIDTAADPELVETLVRNLKDLRKSAAAGTIAGDPAAYGLNDPEAVLKVFADGKTGPLATIELGKALKDRVYVRTGGGTRIEVADPRRLGAATLPLAAWRDTALFHLPSFRVKGVTVRETDPDVTIRVERDDRRWRLLSPIKVPADNDKAEGLVAELTALRVSERGDGFVADDVRERDRAAFGLARPSMTITMTPFEAAAKPQTLRLGKGVPGKPDEVYAMRGDQDEVVRLDVKRLREAVPGPNGLRSQTALDLNPSRIDRVRIDTRDAHYDLLKTPTGWTLAGPAPEPADGARVRALLVALSELKTSEFLDPSRVKDPHLDEPYFRVRGWQAEAGAAPPAGDRAALPKADPSFDLALGRRDAAAKAVYGRVAGDTTVLALPQSILEELPASASAFRDRTILSLAPTEFASVTVERGRSVVKVEAPPETGATGMHWRMTEPVSAPADEAAVTTLLLTLGHLRAESWEADRVGDGKAYGLDSPALRLKWTLHTAAGAGAGAPGAAAPGETRGSLRVGKAKGSGGSFYANVEGDPKVFSLHPGVIDQFNAELHSGKVYGFKAGDAERLVLRWPSRTISVERRARGERRAPTWEVTPGYDPAGFDTARVDAIVTALAGLKTPRFLQYSGPFPDVSGLASPRVTVRVTLAGKAAGSTLRVGRGVNPTTFVATNAPGDVGPVFVLSVDDIQAILDPPARPDDLPPDVFVPEPRPATPPR